MHIVIAWVALDGHGSRGVVVGAWELGGRCWSVASLRMGLDHETRYRTSIQVHWGI